MNSTQKILKNKMGLLNLAEELGNVSKACKIMGYSRDTFYRYKQLVDETGFDNLVEANRRKPNTKNRVDPTVEAAVRKFAVDFPAYGQVRASNDAKKAGYNCISRWYSFYLASSQFGDNGKKTSCVGGTGV